MNRAITLALAAMLANFNGYAEQPTSTYSVKPLVSSGDKIAGYKLPPDTVIDGVALSDAGEAAFVARWTDAGKERTGVFTSRRLVASDGVAIDGKPITHINAASLAINEPGQVAFEADYGSPSQTGIFIESRFVVALSVAGSASDFVLTNDGKVALKAAVAATNVPPPKNARPGGNSNWQRGLSLKVPGAIAGVLFNRNSPVRNADPNVLMQPRPASPPRPQPPSPLLAHPVPNTPPRTCPVPEYPYPMAWKFGDEMSGPIVSRLFESAPRSKTYDSPFFGHINTAFRSIQFGGDCKPLLVVIGDEANPVHFEIWTPNGLLLHTQKDGSIELKGFPENARSSSLARLDTPFRVNRRGQILIPVSAEPKGYAVLLATPAEGSR